MKRIILLLKIIAVLAVPVAAAYVYAKLLGDREEGSEIIGTYMKPIPGDAFNPPKQTTEI